MSRIYVGGLPPDASRREVEREFEYFGPLRDVWVARNPPGFGFIIFDDARDAEDAVRDMDGRRVCGSRVRVEMARGTTRGGGRSSRQEGRRDLQCYECGRNGHTSRQCTRKGERRRRSRSRSRERRRSGSRSPRRSRSRSRSKQQRDDRRRPSGSRSRSRDRKRSRSESKERSRRRSHSPNKNHHDEDGQQEHMDGDERIDGDFDEGN